MKAVVTGAYGQDGSFLCEILTSKGYEVQGIVRTNMSDNSRRIMRELSEKGVNIQTNAVDITDYDALKAYLLDYSPDEIYHMAATHLAAEDASLSSESIVFENNIKSTAYILDICHHFLPSARIVTAGSCLMYDHSKTKHQSIDTPFSSNSYYGIAKITENMLVKMFRDKGLFACTAILYNHESHRRSERFVTKKIVNRMREVKQGIIDSFTLGSLDTEKDWGYAKDYAYAMYLMLQAYKPKDYIVSSDSLHKIRDFIEECAACMGIADWKKYVNLDPSIIARPSETILRGDSSEIRNELGWHPTVSFSELVRSMVNSSW